MHTAAPGTYLAAMCEMIDAMKPGECYDVDIREMASNIASFEHKGAVFNPADRVLENIVGAGATHSYRIHPNGRTVTFVRHENTGEQRYQSPDHR